MAQKLRAEITRNQTDQSSNRQLTKIVDPWIELRVSRVIHFICVGVIALTNTLLLRLPHAGAGGPVFPASAADASHCGGGGAAADHDRLPRVQ